jgi:hypothetical protein
VQDGEHDVNIAAMRFVRDQYQPSLTIWMSHVWVVQPSRQGHWMRAVPANENTTTNTTLTIDLASDVEYLMYKPAAPAETAEIKISKTAEQLILVLKGGRMLTLSGGMYFPQFLVDEELKRRTLATQMSHNLNPDMGLSANYSDNIRMSQKYVESASWKANAIRPEAKDNFLDRAWQAWKYAIAPVVFNPMAWVGAPIFVPATYKGFYYKYKRELELSPAAKMFEKLRCLTKFKSCSWGVDNLVLTSKTCQKPLALSGV